MRIDVHQHLLPEPLLEALERRRTAPRIRRGRSGWLLEVAGETPSSLDLADHDPDARARRAGDDALDHALVALSSVLALDEGGMLIDFSQLKKELRLICSVLDHSPSPI